MTTQQMLAEARATKYILGKTDSDTRNRALAAMADRLIAQKDAIVESSHRDYEAARGTMSDVMLDRLLLNDERFDQLVAGLRDLMDMPDPLGRTLWRSTRPNGLEIEKVSVSMGVIAIVYESRPNVTTDAAGLCIKSGNVCILRSGKAAHATALLLARAMQDGLEDVGLPRSCICLMEDPSHEAVGQLMTAVGYVDLLIPRGGASLINACVQNATVPCIHTGTGICHIYVDRAADLKMAVDIVENAKASRPSVCNAAEVCLVHRDVANRFLPLLAKRLNADRAADGKTPVELRLDERAANIISGTPAGENDFDTEFLGYILGVKIVDSLEEATDHIAKHSTGHSEAIVTADPLAAERFTRTVDSAAVYVNASTRFTDGGEFGFGCEMGISTQKLHARGPMGLAELCSYKYIIHGDGQTR